MRYSRRAWAGNMYLCVHPCEQRPAFTTLESTPPGAWRTMGKNEKQCMR